MIEGFFLLGTLWFWAYIIIPFVLLVWFVEAEWSTAAFWTIIAMVAAFISFGDPSVLKSIQTNPFIVVQWLVAYVMLGIVWGFIKWFFYLLKKRDEYRVVLAEWSKAVENQAANGVPENRLSAKPSAEKARPKASENKGRIIFWMSYWPASALWTLLNDPLTRLYNFLYRQLGKLFDSMSKAIWQNVN